MQQSELEHLKFLKLTLIFRVHRPYTIKSFVSFFLQMKIRLEWLAGLFKIGRANMEYNPFTVYSKQKIEIFI